MTLFRGTVTEADIDPREVVEIHAGHVASLHLPVVAVSLADGAARLFRFADDAARDAFADQLADACCTAQAA